MRLKFPHISRLFSALLLWTFFLGFLTLNAFAVANYPRAYTSKLSSIFAHPLSWEAHLSLARELWRGGSQDAANQEIALAQELDRPQVLGVSLEQEQEEHYWEEVLQDYPDYRDGYIKLASLLYARGERERAKSYLLTAQTLDPNSPVVADLLKLF